MTDPGDPHFYEPFLLVADGDEVHTGDVLAYLYVPPGGGGGPHVHFDVRHGQTWMAPALFDDAVTGAFFDHWGDDASLPSEPCMGYLLEADENPFGTGPSDCLSGPP